MSSSDDNLINGILLGAIASVIVGVLVYFTAAISANETRSHIRLECDRYSATELSSINESDPIMYHCEPAKKQTFAEIKQ
jgi:hypothetical protein